MSEILRYTSNETPRDMINDDGDVLPYNDVDSARDLQAALEEQDMLFLEDESENTVVGLAPVTQIKAVRTPEQLREDKIDHLMNTIGISYDEAEKRI